MSQPHTPHPLVMHTEGRTPQQSPFDQDLPVHTGLEVFKDFPPHETDTTRFGMRQFTHPEGHGPTRVGLNSSGGDGRVVGYAIARRSAGGHAHAPTSVLCIAISIVAGRGQRGQGLGGRVGERRGEALGAVRVWPVLIPVQIIVIVIVILGSVDVRGDIVLGRN
jgi:hypothetical protein